MRHTIPALLATLPLLLLPSGSRADEAEALKMLTRYGGYSTGDRGQSARDVKFTNTRMNDEAGLKDLKEIKSLKRLYLPRATVLAEAAAELKKSMPGCSISR